MHIYDTLVFARKKIQISHNYDFFFFYYLKRQSMAYLYRPGNQWWAGSRRLEQWRGCLCKCWCSRCWSWCYHLCWAVDDCSRRGYYRLGSCCCRPAAGRAGDGESAQTRCCWCANSPRWSPFRSPAVGSVPVDHRLLHRRHRRRSQNDRHRLRPPCNTDRSFNSRSSIFLITCCNGHWHIIL